MLQKVLAIRGPILHLADDADELRVHAMDTQVDDRALAGLYNLIVELLLHLCHYFLDASRMNTSVGNKLMESQAANLTAYRIEG